MAAAGAIRYAYLAFLSKPREDRRLYRLARQRQITKIVELGIGSIERTLRLISVCQRYSPDATIAYTGLDSFDERASTAEPLSLIDAHRQLKAAGAATRLMPGGPTAALPAVANSLLGSDLLLISPDADHESLDDVLGGGWFYVPRILHENSLVLRGLAGVDLAPCWSEVARQDIDALAAAQTSRLAA